MGVYDLAEELRQTKKDLNSRIEIIKKEGFITVDNYVEIQHDLRCIEAFGINPLGKDATKTFNDLIFPLVSNIDTTKHSIIGTYCSILDTFMEQLDVAIAKEEKIGAIAERLSQIQVSLPSGEADPELEMKIQQNTGTIARIIIS